MISYQVEVLAESRVLIFVCQFIFYIYTDYFISGTIPGPILIGVMIDASCSLWDDGCAVRGSCWVYDNLDMSKRIFIVLVVLKIISLGFNILAYFVYKSPPEKVSTELQSMDGLSECNDNNSNNSSPTNSTEKIISSEKGT